MQIDEYTHEVIDLSMVLFVHIPAPVRSQLVSGLRPVLERVPTCDVKMHSAHFLDVRPTGFRDAIWRVFWVRKVSYSFESPSCGIGIAASR